MNKLIIEASLLFLDNDKKKFYTTGLIVDFSIREDMFNSGKIQFVDRQTVFPGEQNVLAIIIFAYGHLVFPYIKKGGVYVFGEPSCPYGKCEVNRISPDLSCIDMY
jgi:hypothetical protein